MIQDWRLRPNSQKRLKMEFSLFGGPVLNGVDGAKISPFDFNDKEWIKKSHTFFCLRIKIFIKQEKIIQPTPY